MLKIPDDVPIENKRVTGAIANAQGQIESQNFESRKNVLKYDDVMDRQRHVIYGERREVLEGADLEEQIRGFVNDVVEGYVIGATEGFAEEWDLEALWTALKQLYPVRSTSPSSRTRSAAAPTSPARSSSRTSRRTPRRRTTRREDEVGEEVLRELERRVVLSVLDRKWRDHLYEMDYLREGIYLRAYSQRDPLVEYQREGFDMFTAMMDGIKEESVGFLFNLEVQIEEEVDAEEAERDRGGRGRRRRGRRRGSRGASRRAHQGQGPRGPEAPTNLSYSGPAEDRRGRRAWPRRRRRPLRGGRTQRRLPVWLGEEVQEVPWCAWWAHGSDDPCERLSERQRAKLGTRAGKNRDGCRVCRSCHGALRAVEKNCGLG